ncbi:MAG: DUF4282 domain-containing protein [Planctomycetota bacterium]
MTDGQGKGFLQTLFDLSFREFVTTRIVQILYVLGILAAALVALAMFVAGLARGGAGILAIVLAPLYFVLSVICIRVWLELVIVIFRISENTEILAKKHKEKE